MECQLLQHFEIELGKQMPLIAPIFGLTLLLLIAWDYFIDPAHAGQSATIRIGLVILGATAYWRTPLRWSVGVRRAVIYMTHTFAAIIPASLLQDGFVHQGAGITTTVFPLADGASRVALPSRWTWATARLHDENNRSQYIEVLRGRPDDVNRNFSAKSIRRRAIPRVHGEMESCEVSHAGRRD